MVVIQGWILTEGTLLKSNQESGIQIAELEFIRGAKNTMRKLIHRGQEKPQEV